MMVDVRPEAQRSERTARNEVEALYRTEGDRLWRALWAYSRDSDIASEALSEAFAQALRRGTAIRQLGPWVWRASFKIAAGEMKRKSRAAVEMPREEPYEMAEHSYDVLSALAGLSSMQRGAMILRYYAGYSTRDIAAALGSTGQAVRIHLSRGRRRLKKILEAEDATG